MDAKFLHIRNALAKRHRTKQAIMFNAVKDRLNKSLNSYASELDSSVAYVETKSAPNVIKKL